MIKPLLLLSVVPVLWCVHPAAAGAGDVLRLEANRAVQIPVGEAKSTVMIVNPEIADVVALKSNQVLVVGRRPGRTELLVIAASGKQLLARTVIVDPASGMLTVNRGTAERSLSCTPDCVEPAPPAPGGQ